MSVPPGSDSRTLRSDAGLELLSGVQFPWARGFVIGTPFLVAIWMWLVASVPRVNGVGTAMVVLAVGGPIVVPIAIGIDHEIRKQNARAKLRDRGMPTIAEVTSLELVPRGPDSGSWVVKFRYEWAGIERQGYFKEGTLRSDPPPMRPGGRIWITIDPDDPSICGWPRVS